MIDKAWLGAGIVAMSLAASGPALAQQGPSQWSADLTVAGDSSDCVGSEMDLFVSNDPAQRGMIEASIVENDYCQDRILLDAQASGPLPKGALTFDGNNVVTLDTTFQAVNNEDHNPVTFSIFAKWVPQEQIDAMTRHNLESPGKMGRSNRAHRQTFWKAEASTRVSSGGRTIFEGPANVAAIRRAR